MESNTTSTSGHCESQNKTKRQRNGNKSGGSVQLSRHIVDEVHDLVNQRRRSLGLEDWKFEDRGCTMTTTVSTPEMTKTKTEEFYTGAEIKEAYDKAAAKNSSIRVQVNEYTKVVYCNCNCGGRVPVGLVMQGWSYISGHKNKFSKDGSFKQGTGESRTRTLSVSKHYETALAAVRMDIANRESEMEEIRKTAQLLTTKLQTIKEDVNKLKQIETNLKSLLPKSNEV